MDLTLCICSRNRSRELQRTLSRVAALKIPEGLQWEMLIVDNGSTDGTVESLKPFGEQLPLVIEIETTPGVSNARNAAIRAFKGEVLYFLDDDVDVESDWLETTWANIAENPQFSIYGGRVLPRWDVKPPKWFVDNYGRIHSNPHVDLGNENRAFNDGDVVKLIGANLGFRRSIFDEGHLFRADLGQTGGGYGKTFGVGGEEIELQGRALRDGHQALYIADSVTYHRDAPQRMTMNYVLRWYFLCGKSEVRTGEFASSPRTFMGIPYYLYRVLFGEMLRLISAATSPETSKWLSARIQMARIVGAMAEFRSRSSGDASAVRG